VNKYLTTQGKHIVIVIGLRQLLGNYFLITSSTRIRCCSVTVAQTCLLYGMNNDINSKNIQL